MMARIFFPAKPGSCDVSVEASISRAIRSEPSLPKSSPLSARNATGWATSSASISLNIFCVDLAAAINATRPVIRAFTAGVASLNNPFASNRAMTKITLLPACGPSVRPHIGGAVATTLYPPIGKHDPDFRHVNDVGGASVGCFPNPFMRSSVRTCHISFSLPASAAIALSSDRFLANNVLARSNNIIGTPLRSIPIASTPPTKPPVTLVSCAGPGAYPRAHSRSSSLSGAIASTSTALIRPRNASLRASFATNACRIKFCHAAGVATNTLSPSSSIVSFPSGRSLRSGADVMASFEHPATPSARRRVTQNAPRSAGFRNARRSASRLNAVTFVAHASRASDARGSVAHVRAKSAKSIARARVDARRRMASRASQSTATRRGGEGCSASGARRERTNRRRAIARDESLNRNTMVIHAR